jgi:hypothetical protein
MDGIVIIQCTIVGHSIKERTYYGNNSVIECIHNHIESLMNFELVKRRGVRSGMSRFKKRYEAAKGYLPLDTHDGPVHSPGV